MSNETGLVLCQHSSPGQLPASPGWRWIKEGALGFQVWGPEDETSRTDWKRPRGKPEPKPDAKPKTTYNGAAEAIRIYRECKLVPHTLRWLAARLGIPYKALLAADVRYVRPIQYGMFAYTSTEPGKAIYLSCQVRICKWTDDDGKPSNPKDDLKKWRGTGSVFFLCDKTLSNRPDFPTLLPEGAGCAYTLAGCGFDVVGRPNNSAGGKQIASFLLPHASRGILLIADNDGGKGLEGAIRCAEEMIRCGIPRESLSISLPRVCKDSRETLNKALPGLWDTTDPATAEAFRIAGAAYVEQLLEDRKPIESAAASIDLSGIWGDGANIWDGCQNDGPKHDGFFDPFAPPGLTPPLPANLPCRRGVVKIMRHKSNPSRTPLIVRLPCGRLTCEPCRGRLIQSYTDTIRKHLGELEPDTPVYAWVVLGEDNWARCTAAIRQHNTRTADGEARYLRVGPDVSTGRSFAVATWLPVSMRTASRELPPAAAADWLIDQLGRFARMPWDALGRIFTHSKAWPLVAERAARRQSNEYAVVGKVSAGVDAVVVVRSFGCSTRRRTAGQVEITEPTNKDGQPFAEAKKIDAMIDALQGKPAYWESDPPGPLEAG